MNVLWFCNMAPPEASLLMAEPVNPSGGWFVNASQLLSQVDAVHLVVAFPKRGLTKIQKFNGKLISYIAFPFVNQKNYTACKRLIQSILEQTKPDITQIFGTEFMHSLAIMECCDPDTTVIHIQGLVSVISMHCYASLPNRVLIRYTFRDLIKNDSIIKQKQKLIARGKYELQILQSARYVMGRTTWDYACTKRINPNIQYYHCNEILRDEFYSHKWDINLINKYSVFVSQGSSSIKGLHILLEAMPDILKRYPQAVIYVGGHNITKSESFIDRIKLSSYGKYLKELIRQYRLEDKVVFLGLLDEQQMCKQYLQSHVFVMPSAIENSPNSMGEAMILGVPCVASDVGGISNLLKHDEEGFVYPFDEPYMLAHYVCELFGSDELALRFSSGARAHAAITHSKEANIEGLLDVYKRIIAAKQ